MQAIQNDHVVEINYTLTDEDGTVLDSTKKGVQRCDVNIKRSIMTAFDEMKKLMSIHFLLCCKSATYIFLPSKFPLCHQETSCFIE